MTVTSIDLKSIVAIVAQYQADLQDLPSTETPLLRKLRLQRVQADLPVLLHNIKRYKTNKAYSQMFAQIHSLSCDVARLLHHNEASMAHWLSQFDQLSTEPSVEPVPPLDEPEDEESYVSLRRRLLSDCHASCRLENATNDELNSYNESVQSDLISELSSLTTALKNSAMTLTSKINVDSELVSEASEHMQKNLSLMLSVGVNLTNYLGAKTGGKITLFFMIKIMVFVFVLFFVMAFIAKVLPKM
ncbi:hypothetical protein METBISCDRAFT_21457 [Metschnikowia bicuspidata]|uniref:Uncharacterized protein n=1 Tax=Metschnikowia bicuspidata TaxID=27322 RepID=A0A4P9ZHM4_9ASCO|nr:hypothetical protein METBISCDRAFT_21457 [Metschnikowia bicuspidata]